MIEVRNLRLALSGGIARETPYDPDALASAVARKLGLPTKDLRTCQVTKRSVDARNKGDVHFVVTARACLCAGSDAEAALVARLGDASVSIAQPRAFELPKLGRVLAEAERPVVVGAGSAGLFCALALAQAGCQPILVERGDDAARRSQVVKRFHESGELDPQCNIQFGAGGAGTFSDGKLTTGTKSADIPWVTEQLVAYGAPDAILWEAHPHIGSDRLPAVVDAILRRIAELGGDVRLRTRLSAIEVSAGHVVGLRLASTDPASSMPEERLACSTVVLACGHSARDVLEIAREAGVMMEPKTFAMGVRVEHPQALIDRAQYGGAAGHPALPAAEYKLSCHTADSRGVFSFCMCPGGTVVAASSEPGGVVTNGMSDFARDGRNANSALLVNVQPTDLPAGDPLAGVELQRRCEQAAFRLGGGIFKAPAQLLEDFLAGKASSGPGEVAPTYQRGVTWGALDEALPPYVVSGLRYGIPVMARRLHGFDLGDAVLTGVETRSSSPVRLTRGADRQSVSVSGLYPCGEGAGYAGGIMSAATDGLSCARSVIEALNGQ